jgi:hypothetical protein
VRNVSLSYRRAVNAQQTGEGIYVLVTIDHGDLPEPIYLNNSGANLESRGITFLACFMQVTILDDDPDKSPQAKLIISNIDRRMVDALRSTVVPCQITLEIVLDSSLDTVEASMTNLEMRDINYDAMMIQGNLTPLKIRSRQAIDYLCTPSSCPGLW